MWKGRLENLILNVRGGSERQRISDERVLPDGLTLMSLYLNARLYRLYTIKTSLISLQHRS